MLATSGLLAATLISAATYFWALSQYSTDDQTRTAKRLEAFVASARSIQLRDGSLVSDLLIAHPAKWLNGVLGHFYQLNDPIVWDIHNTSVLPFSGLYGLSDRAPDPACLAEPLVDECISAGIVDRYESPDAQGSR
jgi:hypothetical protein